MNDHVYKMIDITGSSDNSIEDAVQTAISRSSQSLDHLRWFEITNVRGHIEHGEVAHYQVSMKLGFTLEEA